MGAQKKTRRMDAVAAKKVILECAAEDRRNGCSGTALELVDAWWTEAVDSPTEPWALDVLDALETLGRDLAVRTYEIGAAS